MALGMDSYTRLDQNRDPHDHVNRWNQFLAKWGRQPVYAGRYFGNVIPGVRAGSAWQRGELLAMLAASPLAQSLRYILPMAPPGPETQNRPASLSQHPPLQNQPVFFRQQGETRDGGHLSPAQVRKQAREDANATCEQIEAALNFVDPHTGQHELILPDSKTVFVFLDVEPQTALNPQYWLGWAETVSSFTTTMTTQIGTIDIVQPFRPCLYCVVREDPIDPTKGWPHDKPGPWPEIMGAFSQTKGPLPLPVWIRGKHPCHALATPWPFDSFDVQDAIDATEDDVQAEWVTYGTLQQPLGPDAEVVIWQYQINIGMDAAGNFFETGQPGAPEPVLDIDLSATSSTPYNGRPITDYMLRRP